MKRKLLLILILPLIYAGQIFSQPTDVYVDDDYNSSTPGWGTTHFDAIADGISAVANDGTVHVYNGTYVQTVTLNVHKSCTITGESEAGTIINVSGLGNSWGIHIDADNVTMEYFTVIPANGGTTGGYPIHAADDGNPVLVNDGLDLNHITITGSRRTAFDVHGYDNVILSNLTATGSTYGNGIQVSGCNGVTFSNCTTSGNAWGGIAVYVSTYVPRGSSNVSFDFTTNSVDESFYVEDQNGYTNTNITVSNWTYAIENPYLVNANMLQYTDKTMAYALNIGAALNVKYSNMKSAVYDPTLTNWYVGSGMSIQGAVDAAAIGDIIHVDAVTYTESTQINVNKASLTIQGMGSSNTVIQVSGTGYRFYVTANGITIKDLTIEKTDETGVQNIVYVGANNFSLLNCTIFGQWDFEEGPVVRAMEVTYGISGLLVDNNVFHNLRQPAYINGSLASPTTGTISNNLTYETKGWVIAGANMTFTGNSWENGTIYNVYDVAILSATPASYYTDIVAVSEANNDAVIEDQRVSPAVLSVVYVDASTSFSTDLGGRYHPYATISPAVTRVVSNGKIFVSAGSYASVSVGKTCRMYGANAGIHPAVGTHETEIVGTRGAESVLAGMVPAADNILVDGFKFLKAGTRIIDTYANANGFHLTNCIVESTAFGATTGIMQFGGGSHTDCIFDFNLFIDLGDHTFYAGGGPFDRLTFEYNFFNSAGDAFFWSATPLVDGVFRGNEMDGTIGGNPGTGFGTINIGQAGNMLIEKNYFHDMLYTPIQVGLNNGIIRDNTFEQIYPYSTYGANCFELWGGQWGTAVSTNVNIYDNIIYFNDIAGASYPTHGLRLRAPETGSGIDASTIHVYDNKFLSGGIRTDAYAIRHQGDQSTYVDAEENYWGTIIPSEVEAMFNSPVDYIPYCNENFTYCLFTPPVAIVFVDDDWSTASEGDEVESGKIFGFNAFALVQDGIDAVTIGGTVHVAAGTYTEQLYINKEGLVVDGAGAANTIIKSPATLTLSFATPGVKKPVVFVETVTTCTLSNLTVDGDGKGNANNAFVGVGFWNAGGTLDNVDVISIRDTPFSGAQHGVGVYSYNNTGGPYTINVNDVNVTDFQKNAFALSGDGLMVNMDGVAVTGAGSTTVTAQNGIQIGFGANGSVLNSSVTGIHYVDIVPPIPNWSATAILLYNAGTVNLTSTTVTNSQTAIYYQDAGGTVSGCTVSNPVADVWANGVDVYATTAMVNAGNGLKRSIQPVIEDYIPSGSRTTLTVDVENSTFTGNGFSENYGVGGWAEGTINLTVTGCTSTGWDYGIFAYENGGTINTIVNENDLSGNNYGYYFYGTTLQDAENNWWGHASGPLDSSDDPGGLYNPLGEGSEVTDLVDYDPWYADEDKTIEATTEETDIYNEDQDVYYYSIQDAILAADIGDVIEVTGTHNVKDIVVNKGLKIAAGAGGAKFTGIGGARGGTGLTINTTDPVEFFGTTFEDYDLAIDFIDFGSAQIHECKFINCVAAVNNQTMIEIDADTNYWGHPSGPLDNSLVGLYNPYGLGASVSDYVDYQPWYSSENLNVMPVDIAVYNPSCGHIEVRVRPNSDMTGNLTTMLFALKWLETSPDTVELLNITSSYNIDLQYYATNGGYRYVVFGLETFAPVAWTAETEYVLVEFDLEQDLDAQPEGTVRDFEIANDGWAANNNALYYMEYWGSDYTGYIYGFADDVYLGDCDLQLHLKALLQGPYNTTTNEMKTDLNPSGFIPLGQPFNVAPWNHNGGESIASLPTDMVDWVLVELRSAADGAAVARKAALLFKDGTVRSHIDSFFDVFFTGDFMPNSDFYVVVTARNHMPVMSAGLVNIPNAGDRYDFSNMATYPSYGGATAQVLLETGVHGMISGDVNKDGKLIYSGTDNDRDPILDKIVTVSGDPYINGVIQGYYQEDLTMNSWVKYSGTANDQRLIILNIIELTGIYDLNEQYQTLVPGAVLKSGYSNAGNGPVDIALVENENSLDIDLVTKADFINSYVTNIQFTLSWDANNPMMDAITDDFVTDYKLEPQGGIKEYNGRMYMTFVMVEAIFLPSEFMTGERLTVLSFDKGSFAGKVSKATLANDQFTLQTNGDYYVSVIGKDQTGQVMNGMTGIADPANEAASIQLYPNPATQGHVYITFMPSANESLKLTISDVSSRIVSVRQIEAKSGQLILETINLEGMAKGMYFVRIQGNHTLKTGKFEVQ